MFRQGEGQFQKISQLIPLPQEVHSKKARLALEMFFLLVLSEKSYNPLDVAMLFTLAHKKV